MTISVDKLIEESELGPAIKDNEKLRTKLNEMQQQVDAIRVEITNPNASSGCGCGESFSV